MALAMPGGHAYPVAGRRQLADQVAADETAAAEDANTVSLHAFHILKLILARPDCRGEPRRGQAPSSAAGRGTPSRRCPPGRQPGRVRRDGAKQTATQTAADPHQAGDGGRPVHLAGPFTRLICAAARRATRVILELGASSARRSAMPYATVNPATGEKIREYSEWDAAQLDAALEQAAAAAPRWAAPPIAERCRLLRRAAELLRARRDHYAALITLEMGKLAQQARDEIEKCAAGCDYYAEHAPAFVADELIASDAGRSFVTYQALGTVLAVMPWNFPWWQVFRFAAPASRNTVSMASAHCGTLEACLSTPVLPAASAGAANRNTCHHGKFQGITASTVPSA